MHGLLGMDTGRRVPCARVHDANSEYQRDRHWATSVGTRHRLEAQQSSGGYLATFGARDFRDRTLAANLGRDPGERLELPLPEALQQLVRDDEAVDLVRALVDLGALRVAHQAFDAGFP
jgi:hypothetical protein